MNTFGLRRFRSDLPLTRKGGPSTATEFAHSISAVRVGRQIEIPKTRIKRLLWDAVELHQFKTFAVAHSRLSV
jgi:hypothetical protein